MPMIAMTTSSSTRVNPRLSLRFASITNLLKKIKRTRMRNNESPANAAGASSHIKLSAPSGARVEYSTTAQKPPKFIYKVYSMTALAVNAPFGPNL
jgi:hypothetical protein